MLHKLICSFGTNESIIHVRHAPTISKENRLSIKNRKCRNENYPKEVNYEIKETKIKVNETNCERV